MRSPWPVLLLTGAFVATLPSACERPPARFPHTAHLLGLRCGTPGAAPCLDCNSCHLLPSSTPHERALINGSLCSDCHHRDGTRVLAEVERLPIHASTIEFNHERHLALGTVQGQCVSCHAGVIEPGGAPLPAMSQCFSCHEHEQQWNEGRCAPCHRTSDLARTLPQSFLRHDRAFVQHHAQPASEQRQLCRSCHTEADCNGCHDTSQGLIVERRRPEQLAATRIHDGDFLSRHGLEAQARETRCARCHAPETCDDCHRQRGVSGTLSDGRNPHPPGWIGTNTGASSFHGAAARRDILSCAGCHDQGPATNCIRCHKVGAYGGNPHPNGWRSSQSPGDTMCRYCHG